ncbi:hypothetical protein B0E45_18270 [Sinorhizobium sp. A49]|nr:hypothetical protein B0E45_18270 [Sinorhizobium sp. A49]
MKLCLETRCANSRHTGKTLPTVVSTGRERQDEHPLLHLALTTFATGTAENIVTGILPDAASGPGISIGLAGQWTVVLAVTWRASPANASGRPSAA